ncbi:Nickel transporter UreH [Minicystis rosea]|nr:Nickel transporter UreH [Minicystis rosea]
MTLPSMLVLGFILGMKHATDADHVVAVTTIVSRDRSLRGAARIGSLWGAGHTLTVLLVGGAIILFGLVIPPRLGLALELAVGVMLVVLGALALRSNAHDEAHGALARADRRLQGRWGYAALRPLLVGVVHGLAGSAAVALLVLGSIRDPRWAVAYLGVFGVGTVAGMVLLSLMLAVPLSAASGAFARAGRWMAVAAGVASVALGLFLVYRIGFVDGLFTSTPHWTPG